MKSKKDLSPEQRQCIKDVLNKRRGCITPDCGFGKTIVALTAFTILKKRIPDAAALIVAPPSGAKKTWLTEHLEWSHTQNLKVASLMVPIKDRRKVLEENNADIYVASYNILKWVCDNNTTVRFDFIFADEGSCLKGSSSMWRKYLTALAPLAKWKILATATPKQAEEDDYWGLCKFMDGGEALGKNITDFRSEYMHAYTSPKLKTPLYKMNKKKIPQLEERIKHLFWNYELSDRAKIPIRTFTYNAELTKESQELFNRLKVEQCINSLIDCKKYAVNDKDSGKLDALAISAKLNQLSSGFMYVDTSLRIDLDMLKNAKSTVQLIKSTKRREAIEVFDDRMRAFGRLDARIREIHGDVPVAICYYFTHELTQLQELFPDAILDTDDNLIEKWNSGKYKHLLLQYSRSSMSLNLQHAGYVMAMYSSTFKWADDYQIIRRLARQGQKAECVYLYRLNMIGTIDDVKAKKLSDRFIGHKRFQNAILRSNGYVQTKSSKHAQDSYHQYFNAVT